MKEGWGRKRRRRLQRDDEEEDEKAETAAGDRISGLPDHLLHEILACLPTRIAVGTSLLSRRWRTVWTTSPDLSFTTSLISPSFVDSALRLRDPAVPLRSFSLVAASADDVVSIHAQLLSWISHAAASPALECLTVRTDGLKHHQHLRNASPAAFRLPSLFTLPSLRVLEIAFPRGGEGITHIDWPATAFLPSLQRLELTDLSLCLPAGDAISRSCPALKYCRLSLYITASSST